jgi:glycolate oxidase FAD binding subunit
VPHDLVVTAQSGLPLAALQTTLAQSNQWLALDPDLPPTATIGGIVATNVSGPRRLRYGGMRDQIIGVRVVLADGTVAKGGGKVVKNVAGYDLPKLFTGALGTLGVIVSATFRLYPLPVASRTVQLTASALTPLCDLAVRVIGSTLVPTMVDVFGATAQENAYTMAVRFEMGQESVEAQAATLLAMAAEMGIAPIQEAPILEGDAESQFWAQAGHATSFKKDSRTTLTLKASLLPSEVARWLTRLKQVCQQQQTYAIWRAHAGHGLVHVHLTGDAAAVATTAQELRQAAMEHQGSMVLTEVPLELMPRIDVWGPVPAWDVMRNLKARFDPQNVLNPGRFVGGL